MKGGKVMKKSTKNLISIFLIFMLNLSLSIPVQAANLPFSDSSRISHGDAVETLYIDGTINGYPDGSFGPGRTLTRAEACAILTRILSGTPKGAAKFSDVSSSHWAAGYIAYCYDNQIILGYGGGIFGPEDTLTGSAWGKMLLTSFGYDAVENGMTGSDWEGGVEAAASEQDLYNGIGNINPSRPVSRDNACQMVFNLMYDGRKPAPPNMSQVMNQISYSFPNHERGFGYPDPYCFPLKIFQMVFGDTAKAQSEYEDMKERGWGGNCFGMAATAGMIYEPGDGISTSLFSPSATMISQLTSGMRNDVWNLTLTEFIETSFLTQCTPELSKLKTENGNKLSEVVNLLSQTQETGRKPVLIGIKPEAGKGGHAVLGYGISDDRILIYDSNYPLENRSIRLTKNSNGQYTGWSYALNSKTTWGTSTGGYMYYIPFKDYYDSWQNRMGSVINTDMTLLSASDNVVVRNQNGSVAARIENGVVTERQSNVYPVDYDGILPDQTETEANQSVYLPGHDYSVERTSGSGSFEVTLTDVDQSVRVNTDASKVTLSVNDDTETRIVSLDSSQEGSSYSTNIISTLDDGSPAEITSSGTVAPSGTTVGERSGSIVTSGASNVKADGREVTSGSAKKATDYDLLSSTFSLSSTELWNGGADSVDLNIGPSGGYMIRALSTYHWNNGYGTTPGTISVYDVTDGSSVLLGSWQAVNREGEEFYWDIFPDIELEPEHSYRVTDSDSFTWTSDGNGLTYVEIRGEYLSSPGVG